MIWWRLFGLTIVGLVYLVVVWLTYSWMIAAPRKWLVLSQTDRLRVTVDVADLVGNGANQRISAELRGALTSVRDSLKKESDGVIKRAFRAVNLNELMAAQQTVNGLSRQRVYLVSDADLPAFACPVFAKLRETDPASEESLRSQFYFQLTSSDARRILISRADEFCHAAEDAALRAEFDRERASLWLAMVGLSGIIAVGSMLGYLEVMLVGAIGGFLAPIVDARKSDSKEAGWGVRVLSPVGGALTAVAGVLVVMFLASLGVLGEPVQKLLADPRSAAVLAIALLFGFSGKLFSSMAITATSQIAGAAPAPTTPATP